MLLQDGTYNAVVRDVSLYCRGDNDRLTAAFKLDVEDKELVHREWVELNDGTISDRAIQRMQECFPTWDGSIEALAEGTCCFDVAVDVVIENEQDQDDPEKWWTRVKWMNAPGGGKTAATLPDKADRSTLVSKYSARFRALAGGAPAKKAEAPPTKPSPSAPKPAATESSTLEECWEKLCTKHPDELHEQVSERWFALMEQTIPDKDQSEFTGEDWAKIAAAI